MAISAQPFEDPLEALLQKAVVHSSSEQQLAASLLAEAWQVEAFNLTTDTVLEVTHRRLQHFQQIYATLNQLCLELGWPACPPGLLWRLWLPLAEKIAAWRESLTHPLIQGILGVQGTGKTTLTLILSEILRSMNFQVCHLSIDDLYKTYAERQQLQQIDPRFQWRGPPGTHDVELGLTALHQLKSGSTQPIAIPRFDKSTHNGAGDRTQPELVSAADIVLFEGWFVGVRPIDPKPFETAPLPIETAADRAFAREVNTRLQAYLPLWDLLDKLIVLYSSDYHLSQQWRRQAEQQMAATGRTGMSNIEIDRFVQYFWRSMHPELFIQPLLHDAEHVDLVIEIDAAHYPQAVYRPGNQQQESQKS